MSDPVKGTRRSAQAGATRRRITDAATELFVADGYGVTTLGRIATRAGVAVQTVYFHFGNKSTVLKEALDIAAVGDDEPVPLLDRPWMQELRAEPEPRRVVRLWVRGSRAVIARVAPIMQVVRGAVGTDPDLAAQWATNQAQTATAFGEFARLLDDRGALRPELTVPDAADLAFALLSTEVYLLLTVDRGRSEEEWERWMADVLVRALLA
jgi:AcrR family transcriptional regulator